MVDLMALKEVVDNSGMTITAIAKKSGIERGTIYNRFSGIGEFTASEIQGMCDTLHLGAADRNRIFFAKEVEQKETK